MNEKKYMIQLDGLRAIAVALVMFGHWTMAVKKLEKVDHFLASVGVNLFFVLSGFLITLILINEKDKDEVSKGFIIKRFYIRRFLRIFPLYYFAITVGMLLRIPNGREHFLLFFTYTANWLIGINNGNCGWFTHLWSLCVEEQFYIFFPFLFLIVKKEHTKNMFISITIFAIIIRGIIFFLGYRMGFTDKVNWMNYSFTPCCLDSFGIGALLAFFKFYYNEKTFTFLSRIKTSFFPFAILIIAGYLDIYHDTIIANFINNLLCRLLISIFSVWLIGIASYSSFTGSMKSFLENKVIVYLGKISYGLYMYHYFVLYFETHFYFFNTYILNFIVSRLCLLTVTIIVASTSWYLFEKPINKLKKYFSYSFGFKKQFVNANT